MTDAPHASASRRVLGSPLLAAGTQALVLTVGSVGYGFHRDELYFRMLPPAWGYVDQPPLAPWLARTLTGLVDEFGKTLYGTANMEIVDRVADIAAARGVSRAAIGLAWVSRHPAVTAPIVGIGREQHLSDALASIAIELSDDEVRVLEEPYTPQPVSGFA